jgi:hypothetical protein
MPSIQEKIMVDEKEGAILPLVRGDWRLSSLEMSTSPSELKVLESIMS